MDKILTSGQSHRLLATTDNVLRNACFLLGLKLTFSAISATASTVLQLPAPGFILRLVGFYGLMFLTCWLADKPSGILAAFAFTGCLGYCLGPVLSRYLAAGMGEAIALALGDTAAVFLLFRLCSDHPPGYVLAGWYDDGGFCCITGVSSR